MSEVGIRALKQNTSKVVARARAGGSITITITDRGRPVALLGPIKTSRVDGMGEAGLATPPSMSIRDLPPPAPRLAGQSPLSEIIDDDRADRI